VADHEEMRRRLEARRAKLTERPANIERDRRRLPDPDTEERAPERANDEVLEHLVGGERAALGEIEQALARIAAGTYGTCEACGEAIAPARLEAVPEAVRCIDCA